MVIVLHAVFARNTRNVVRGAVVVQGLIGPHELGQFVGPIRVGCREFRVGPTKVVETGNMAQTPTNRDDVANGFINGIGGHMVGINIAVTRADAVGDDHAFHAIE